MGRLQDKVAIITGAGQGIGLAYAERFLAEGAKVVVAEINDERAQQRDRRSSAARVSDHFGHDRHLRSRLRAALRRRDRQGVRHRHILVNNAALYYDIDNFDPSYEYLQKVTAVNQHGAWLMTRAAAPVMAKQQYGRVINQSSGAAYMYHVPEIGDDSPGSGTTATRSRSGASSGSRSSWPRSSGSTNITVNCIAPGVTMTEATKKIVPDFYIQGMTAQTAMKSTLEPEDLAGACVFFASDDAKFVTGQTLVIDGGLAMPA